MSVLLLILAIACIVALIVTHELGHFIVARRGGVVAEEFGVFFPPRLFKRKMRGGWLFSIGLIPAGGFVKLKGEHDTDTGEGSYGAASLWVKTKVMAAGIIVNILTALILLTLLALTGLPDVLPNQFTVKSDTKIARQEILITSVQPGSPAAQAGLKPDDQLVAMGRVGKPLQTVGAADTLPALTQSLAGKPVTIAYKHQGTLHKVNTTLLSSAAVAASQHSAVPKGYLGVSPTGLTLRKSTWSAPIVAVGFSVQATVLTYQGIGQALSGLGSTVAGLVTHNTAARQHGQTAANNVAGPIGLIVILKDSSTLGLQFILFIIAIIALTLGIMNILPLPALDGGRLWITLIAHAFKRPLSAHTEEVVNATGFLVLLGLLLIISISDVYRFIL